MDKEYEKSLKMLRKYNQDKLIEFLRILSRIFYPDNVFKFTRYFLSSSKVNFQYREQRVLIAWMKCI